MAYVRNHRNGATGRGHNASRSRQEPTITHEEAQEIHRQDALRAMMEAAPGEAEINNWITDHAIRRDGRY